MATSNRAEKLNIMKAAFSRARLSGLYSLPNYSDRPLQRWKTAMQRLHYSCRDSRPGLSSGPAVSGRWRQSCPKPPRLTAATAVHLWAFWDRGLPPLPPFCKLFRISGFAGFWRQNIGDKGFKSSPHGTCLSVRKLHDGRSCGGVQGKMSQSGRGKLTF
jgi:hypothetical protein